MDIWGPLSSPKAGSDQGVAFAELLPGPSRGPNRGPSREPSREPLLNAHFDQEGVGEEERTNLHTMMPMPCHAMSGGYQIAANGRIWHGVTALDTSPEDNHTHTPRAEAKPNLRNREQTEQKDEPAMQCKVEDEV